MTNNPLLEFSREEKEEWARYEELLYKMGRNSRLEYAKEQGIKRVKIETAENFLRMGLPAEQVAQGTKLSIEKVREIEDSLK